MFFFIFQVAVMSDFKDSVVFITGASSGIGAETALLFASYGAKLVILARNEAKLEEVALKCKENGSPDVLVIPMDLSNIEACETAMETAMEHFQGIFYKNSYLTLESSGMK